MKIADVVSQMQLVLPKYTDYFDGDIGVSSIIATATLATITTTAAHGLATGDPITIIEVRNQNSLLTISKDGLVYTFTTSDYHDLTLGYPGYETVLLGGFIDPAWNGNFTLVDVPSRNTFKIRTTNSPPIGEDSFPLSMPYTFGLLLDHTEHLDENRIDGINGRYASTVIDSNTITVSGTFKAGSYSSGQLKKAVRIAGSIDIERTIEEYTQQSLEELWAFVSMHDVSASKDRNAYNDAVATFARGEDPRLRLIDGFSVYLIGNVTGEIAATDTLDIMRHDLLGPLLKTLYGVKFGTGLSTESDFKCILTSHNQVFYNRAILVYQYAFEFSSDITLDDAANEDDTRAFSEFEYTHEFGTADTEYFEADSKLPE